MKYAELLVLALADTIQFPGSDWLLTQTELVTEEVLQVLNNVIQQLSGNESSNIDTIYDGELFNYLYSSLLLMKEIHNRTSVGSLLVERRSQFMHSAQQIHIFHPHIIKILQELQK